MTALTWLAAGLLAVSACWGATVARAQSKLRLPSAETSKAIGDLPVSETEAASQRRAAPRELTR